MSVRFGCVVLGWFAVCHGLVFSAERLVATNAELRAALRDATAGDEIVIQPGVYSGGLFRSGLTDVVIRGADPANAPILRGGANAIQLSDARRVTIENLIVEQQTGNGLNIDDGGTFDTPSSEITLRHLVVRDIVGAGNLDGIKLSGVTGFVIDEVQVLEWGNGGSAVDMVGSHHGLIQNSFFRHATLSNDGSGIRPKGGSKEITIRANRLELPAGTGRALQAGGSTGTPFFRFIDGDSNYEAHSIIAEGNVVLGSSSPFSFVNIDGGVFHHNYTERPRDWVVRILNENPGNAMVDTQNGQFTDNVIRFRDTSDEFRTAVNVGSETLPATYQFARNQWYNEADPARSRPNLPVTERDAIVGVVPTVDANGAIPWQFDWGVWLVNATKDRQSYSVEDEGLARRARAGDNSEFRPLEDSPFGGDWIMEPLNERTLTLEPFSQTFLLRGAMTGDLNSNGMLDVQDLDALSSAVRNQSSERRFDLNRDGLVSSADRTFWVHALRGTTFGDATLDGRFNTTDLVTVFQAGLYETGTAATWAHGDWDGDGRFGTSDLLLAFQDGGYESADAATTTVPEPTGWHAILVTFCIMVRRLSLSSVS